MKFLMTGDVVNITVNQLKVHSFMYRRNHTFRRETRRVVKRSDRYQPRLQKAGVGRTSCLREWTRISATLRHEMAYDHTMIIRSQDDHKDHMMITIT